MTTPHTFTRGFWPLMAWCAFALAQAGVMTGGALAILDRGAPWPAVALLLVLALGLVAMGLRYGVYAIRMETRIAHTAGEVAELKRLVGEE